MLVAERQSNNYTADILYDIQVEERRRKKREQAFKRRKKEKILFKLSCISFITFFAIISFFILKGYSTISQSRMNITKLEKRRNELEQIKYSMESELEEAKSSVKISEEAMYKLSMDYPNKDQVVYLSLDNSTDKSK